MEDNTIKHAGFDKGSGRTAYPMVVITYRFTK
jgi:hypothetical protein